MTIRRKAAHVATVLSTVFVIGAAASVRSVAGVTPNPAHAVFAEKPLTGEALTAVKDRLSAFVKERESIQAREGVRAAFDALTTKDFTFTFVPFKTNETITREHFLKTVNKDCADFLNMNKDQKTSRPDTYAVRKNGSEFVHFVYPVMTTVETEKNVSPARIQVDTTVKEVFVQTPKGLRLKSMAVIGWEMSVNGVAIPTAQFTGNSFDKIMAPEDTDE